MSCVNLGQLTTYVRAYTPYPVLCVQYVPQGTQRNKYIRTYVSLTMLRRKEDNTLALFAAVLPREHTPAQMYMRMYLCTLYFRIRVSYYQLLPAYTLIFVRTYNLTMVQVHTHVCTYVHMYVQRESHSLSSCWQVCRLVWLALHPHSAIAHICRYIHINVRTCIRTYLLYNAGTLDRRQITQAMWVTLSMHVIQYMCTYVHICRHVHTYVHTHVHVCVQR